MHLLILYLKNGRLKKKAYAIDAGRGGKEMNLDKKHKKL